jgi:hypothetical protein
MRLHHRGSLTRWDNTITVDKTKTKLFLQRYNIIIDGMSPGDKFEIETPRQSKSTQSFKCIHPRRGSLT